MSKTTKTQAGERTQHTPGPWGKPWQIQGRQNQTEIMIQRYYPGPQNVVVKGRDHEANARLIAAAPTLLALLKRFYAYTYGCTDDVIPDLDFEQARAAIALAEGRAK